MSMVPETLELSSDYGLKNVSMIVTTSQFFFVSNHMFLCLNYFVSQLFCWKFIRVVINMLSASCILAGQGLVGSGLVGY